MAKEVGGGAGGARGVNTEAPPTAGQKQTWCVGLLAVTKSLFSGSDYIDSFCCDFLFLSLILWTSVLGRPMVRAQLAGLRCWGSCGEPGPLVTSCGASAEAEDYSKALL